jgi:hypothetical protein
MQANQKTDKQAATKEVRTFSQDTVEADSRDSKSLSKDDVKFVGELGWLTAAAVLVAGVAANL